MGEEVDVDEALPDLFLEGLLLPWEWVGVSGPLFWDFPILTLWACVGAYPAALQAWLAQLCQEEGFDLELEPSRRTSTVAPISSASSWTFAISSTRSRTTPRCCPPG